jgi:mxaD protein
MFETMRIVDYNNTEQRNHAMKTTRITRITRITLLALSACAAASALAAAPTLHVTKRIIIDATADKVWAAARDFDALNTWHPAVAKDEIVAGKNDTVGAVRLLTLQGGGTIQEKLLAFDAAGHSFRYTIVEGVLPVSHYTSTFRVRPAGPGKAEVTWSGHFQRKDTSEKPAEGADDKTAVTTIGGVYQGGLDNLKKVVEGAAK